MPGDRTGTSCFLTERSWPICSGSLTCCEKERARRGPGFWSNLCTLLQAHGYCIPVMAVNVFRVWKKNVFRVQWLCLLADYRGFCCSPCSPLHSYQLRYDPMFSLFFNVISCRDTFFLKRTSCRDTSDTSRWSDGPYRVIWCLAPSECQPPDAVRLIRVQNERTFSSQNFPSATVILTVWPLIKSIKCR